MAQKIKVTLVDDLDGQEADETVKFSIDGKPFEIDLTRTNADKFRSMFKPYVANGRRLKPGSRKPATTRTAVPADNTAVRAWAEANGHPVAKRGRVPAQVRAAYEKATNSK
ncbi:histone-like nucleoid-structuring protein Lsr2 [Streptomyces sp. BH105]|uniref:histone-like nucleoid-structuring protein Lsr2 n=1 Tax=Streptomyces sp. BH105 TaxID=3410408 RepID=UPI003CE9A6A8